ncbi:MAG: type II toxin-antitoxin system VapC family toxin [Rhodanobacter sp.]|jgi:predicted nucleic acid-binding protein|nr:type II toxin-antitoxin system VapC family toxin [Rhodanobacter sp.]
MILVDTNVLIDVFEADVAWSSWSAGQLRAQARVHALAIDPVVYAELSASFVSPEEMDDQLTHLRIGLSQAPRPALFLAGKAFVQYRRRGGHKTGVLPDFLIGAHAAVRGCPILTRDARRYREYFPIVELITPEP